MCAGIGDDGKAGGCGSSDGSGGLFVVFCMYVLFLKLNFVAYLRGYKRLTRLGVDS